MRAEAKKERVETVVVKEQPIIQLTLSIEEAAAIKCMADLAVEWNDSQLGRAARSIYNELNPLVQYGDFSQFSLGGLKNKLKGIE